MHRRLFAPEFGGAAGVGPKPQTSDTLGPALWRGSSDRRNADPGRRTSGLLAPVLTNNPRQN